MEAGWALAEGVAQILLGVVALLALDQLNDAGCGCGCDDVVFDCGCKGCENWVIVGAMGWMAARSGVTVLKPPVWALRCEVATGEDTGGVDQENVGVGVEFLTLEEEDAADGFVSQLSSGLVLVVLALPLTSASKSVSDVPFASREEPAIAPNDRKSSLRPGDVTAPPVSSCSFFVCSSSTLLDSDLISSMKAWNSRRFN